MRTAIALLLLWFAAVSVTPAHAQGRGQGRTSAPATRPPRGVARAAFARAQGLRPRALSSSPVSFMAGLHPEIAARLSVFLGASLLAALDVQRTTHTEHNPFVGRTQPVGLSPIEEVALGDRFAPAMVMANGGVHPDPVLQGYVQALGAHVLAANGVGGLYPFRFTVLAGETPNALALPGGHVFVTVGLLRRMRSEAGLALTLAHEITHVLGRHAAENLVQDDVQEGVLGAAVIASMGLPNAGRELTEVRRALELGLLRHSRGQESESDLTGLHFAHRAGFDVTAGARDLVGFLGRNEVPIPEELSNHPRAATRGNQFGAELLRTGFQGGEVGSDRYFLNVLARIGAK